MDKLRTFKQYENIIERASSTSFKSFSLSAKYSTKYVLKHVNTMMGLMFRVWPTKFCKKIRPNSLNNSKLVVKC